MQDLAVVLRIVLIAVFFTSAIAKIKPSTGFEGAIQQFSQGLVGPQLSRIFARALPVFEFVLALLLASGWWLKAVAVVASVTLLLFTAAMAVSLAQGNRVRCNCFGAASSAIGIGSLSRNIILIAASLTLLTISSWTASAIEPLHADLQTLSNPNAVALFMAGFGVYAMVLVVSEIDSLFHSTTAR